METNLFKGNGIRLAKLESLSPKMKKLLTAFYMIQEKDAVNREDYEQAILWRDAGLGKLDTVSVAVSEDDYHVQTWTIDVVH